MKTIALIDGDIFAHKAVSAHLEEIEWEFGVCSITCDTVAATQTALNWIRREAREIEADEIRLCFSSGSNWRKDLEPTYKANRSGMKPPGFRVVMRSLSATYEAFTVEGLEADDVLGIMATTPSDDRFVIVSEDKDLLQIPGEVYVPRTETLHQVTEAEGDRWHLIQTLTGDKTDNYPGCPGVGDKTAPKHCGSWESVLERFEQSGKDEDFALLQARLARILRYGEFDWHTKQPILWTPATTAQSSTEASPTSA